MDIARTRCDFVQGRLPDVIQRTVDQRDVAAPQPAAELASQLKPTGATANNHDFI